MNPPIGVSSPALNGPLDTLVAQGATIRFAGSVRRLKDAYAGPALKLRGNGAGLLADVFHLTDGSLDLSAAAAVAADSGGTESFWHTLYDQFENVDATQTTDASQPPFSTSIEARGAMGRATAAASTWLNINLGVLTLPFLVSMVVRHGASGSTRQYFGRATASAPYIVCLNTTVVQQHWGAVLAGGATAALAKHTLSFLSNGAASTVYKDGVQGAVGNTAGTSLDLTNGRIGASNSPTTNWFSVAGQTMSEFIVFGNDPTGLAGWSDFMAAQKTHFGF